MNYPYNFVLFIICLQLSPLFTAKFKKHVSYARITLFILTEVAMHVCMYICIYVCFVCMYERMYVLLWLYNEITIMDMYVSTF